MAQGTRWEKETRRGHCSETSCDPERAASIQSIPPRAGLDVGREAIMKCSPVGKIETGSIGEASRTIFAIVRELAGP